MPRVELAEALYLIPPLDDPGDRDFGFDYDVNGDLELIDWSSFTHPDTPTQAEIDAAEAAYTPTPSQEAEEAIGITPQQLQDLLPSVGYIYANNESEIPSLTPGRRFFYAPEATEYFAYQPDSNQPGEWWSEPIYDGGGTNGNCPVDWPMRRFNGMHGNENSGIPLKPGWYRLLFLEACWENTESDPKIEIFLSNTSIGMATDGDNQHLNHAFPINANHLFEVTADQNIFLRWKGAEDVRNPQARIMFRRVIFAVEEGEEF